MGSDISVTEAGRRGGSTTNKRYGAEHYRKIGKLGGRKAVDKLGAEHYREMAVKGGKATATSHDMTELAAKGGAACLAKHGTDHFKRIGAMPRKPKSST